MVIDQKNAALGLGRLVRIFVGPSWPISSGGLLTLLFTARALGPIALGPRLTDFSAAFWSTDLLSRIADFLGWTPEQLLFFFVFLFFVLRIQTRRPTLLNRIEQNYTAPPVTRGTISLGMLHCLARKWAIELPERLTWEKLQEWKLAASSVNFHGRN